MRNILTFLLVVIIINSCDNKSNTEPIQDFESQIEELKFSIIKYNKVARNFDLNRVNLLDRGEEGYLSQVSMALNNLYPDDQINTIASKVKSKIGTEELSDKLLERQNSMIGTVQGSLDSFYSNLYTTNLRTLEEEDSISVDSVYSYFEDFKVIIKQDLVQEELDIYNDPVLTNTEKLTLMAALFNYRESIEPLVDGLVEDMINDEIAINGRTTRFFKRLKNWFKRTVNVIATVITRAIPPALTGALVGFAFLGPAGLPWGAAVGGILGAVDGLDCYSSNTCVTCVFCQPDQNKPCYATSSC